MERRVNVVIQHARLRAEADNKTMATMDARICELENASDELQRRRAADAERRDTASIEQREAASVRADHASKMIDAPLRCADGDTAVAKEIELGRSGPTVQSETDTVLDVDVAVRSYAATLHLPTITMERDKGEKRHGAAKSVKWTCIRCGGCGHLHQQCKAEAKAVIWGIDWAKRRDGRKRRRKDQKRMKNAGMKTRGVVAVMKGRTTTNADGGAVGDADRVEVIDRPRGVKKRPLRETGGGGADVDGKLSNGGHLKEVGKTAESEREEGEPRHEERLKEIAREESDLDTELSSRLTLLSS
jgi:hypothetical protein